VLSILDNELRSRRFVAGDVYTIADMSVFAYTHLAADAGFEMKNRTHLTAWCERVRSQPGFLAEMYPYTVDPHSSAAAS
jgi:glutathione S-transferase